MYMTDKERKLRDDAIRFLSNVYPYTRLLPYTHEIVSLQFFLGAQTTAPRSNTDVARNNSCRVLLAKMRAARESIEPVLVTWNVTDMEQREDMSWFYKIRQKYTSNWNGLGQWSGETLGYESLAAAFNYAISRQYPAVIPIDMLRSMRQVYISQETAAREAAERAKTSKRNEKIVKPDDDLDQFIGVTANARRETIADGRGSCFRCGVPKPRGRVCLICGYAPRSIAGRM